MSNKKKKLNGKPSECPILNIKDYKQFDQDDKEKKKEKLESTYKELIKVRSLVLQFINT